MYGDVHRTPRKALGLIPFGHFGVEMPGGDICENSMPGTRLVPFDDFARGRPTQVQNPGATAAERAQAVQRAASCLGERRYHLAAYNCEHFANWCARALRPADIRGAGNNRAVSTATASSFLNSPGA
jgi:hypothetical protein